ncbi:MAG: carboxylesterase/lipase family protein [Pseudomonadales bacterium]|nr:carboxylesterase/lipase family protein [Pseudomonadales bacterium]
MAEAPIARITGGIVQGDRQDDINCFKGIRYGADTGGANRFRPPQPVEPWEGVRLADAFGPDSPQSDPDKPARASDAAVQVLGIEGEDCLRANVWTPSMNGKRPVLVWLHGGGFVSGSGSGIIYDGTRLARRGDVVVITLNHRLGALGYMNLEGFVQSDEPLVNLGMLDIVAALRWVQDNVAAFGGDPGNVTVFGESGGGRKVSTLLAMPDARGLFHRGVIQSGPAVFMNDADASKDVTRRILEEAGETAPTLASLQAMPLERLMKAQLRVLSQVAREEQPGLAQPLAAVVDGTILPNHPFDPEAPSISDDIPVMIGWNQTEATLWLGRDPDLNEVSDERLATRITSLVGDRAREFIANYRQHYPEANNSDLLAYIATGRRRYPLDSLVLAERKAQRAGAPVWLYTLRYRTTARRGALRTPHALEIPFVFDNVDTSRRFVGDGEGPQAMAEQMSECWLAFARGSDPNHPGIPHWPAYDPIRRESMLFDVESTIATDYGRVERETFGKLYYP